MKTTTDLNVIRTNPNQYEWGKITQFHMVGPYTVVEYQEIQGDVTRFALYIDGKELSRSTTTLDEALILVVAHKNLDRYTSEADYMGLAACKILGLKK